MPRLETLSEMIHQVLVNFPCLEYDATPWIPLRQELAQSTVALVTTAGLHLREDKPFISDPKGGDASALHCARCSSVTSPRQITGPATFRAVFFIPFLTGC